MKPVHFFFSLVLKNRFNPELDLFDYYFLIQRSLQKIKHALPLDDPWSGQVPNWLSVSSLKTVT